MGRAGSRAASVWAASARGGAQPWPAWSGDQPRHCTVHTYLGVGVANVVRNIGECGWCADRDAPPGVTMRELCGGAGGGGAACSDLARPSLGWAGGAMAPWVGSLQAGCWDTSSSSSSSAALSSPSIALSGRRHRWRHGCMLATPGPGDNGSHSEDMLTLLTSAGHLDRYQ